MSVRTIELVAAILIFISAGPQVGLVFVARRKGRRDLEPRLWLLVAATVALAVIVAVASR
jgi:hypothetical protein